MKRRAELMGLGAAQVLVSGKNKIVIAAWSWSRIAGCVRGAEVPDTLEGARPCFYWRWVV